MWIWQECEDYFRAAGDVSVADDWGAAAMRCAEMRDGASIVCATKWGGSDKANVAVRYRSAAESPFDLEVAGRSLRIEPAEAWRWRWALVSGVEPGRKLALTCSGADCALDGFFVFDELIDLPDNVKALDAIVGTLEAEGVVDSGCRLFGDVHCPAPSLKPLGGLPSEVVRACAGGSWPVIESLAAKRCPYIVSAFDVGGTDYNSDYSWHALDKEKQWELPWSGALGIVNPNSDIAYVLGFGVDGERVRYPGLSFRVLAHLANLLIYEVELDPMLRAEVVFECRSSDTVVTNVQVTNYSESERRVLVADLFGKDVEANPPGQRYVLPNQKFGAGVTTTAGGLLWRGVAKHSDSVSMCFSEWVRGRWLDRKLLVTARSIVTEGVLDADADPADAWDTAEDAGLLPVEVGELALRVPGGGSVSVAIAFNMHRFTTGSTWNPEVTPLLYPKQTEREAVEFGCSAVAQALSMDLEEAIRRSIEPYRVFPRVRLAEKSWEADFLACLELPRASTFSAYGGLETPFYNFCRVHAHEPFGWWSYGMHAHESLSTLFANITDPGLSSKFLLGHIRHQREDGKYPYGVSHTINPRLTTNEATAPLIVWEAWQSYLWSGDREFLAEAYESGKRNHDWWLRERDRCGEGLCHWLDTCNESVRDDRGLPTWQLTGGSQYQEALDLNCYLVVQARTLSRMARELGLADDAERYGQLADRVARTMNAHMWHEGDQVYYGIGEVLPSWADVKDISTFLPLWAGLAPKGRFERIVELVSDPETFGTPYGPPTLAANEPCFGPEKHWYGSNWVEMSMFVVDGLKRYGHYQRAADLAYRNTKMVFDELEKHGHFREYFSSVDGGGVDLIDYIWTAMPAHFIVNVFLGVEPTAEGLAVLPALPSGWNAIAIENLRVRGRRVCVSVRADARSRETVATVDGVAAAVEQGRGVVIPWEAVRDGMRIEVIQPESVGDVPSAPREAPRDWSDIAPHGYSDDEELISAVRAAMKTKEECRELF